MTVRRSFFLVAWLASASIAHAACDKTAEGAKNSYERAVTLVKRLPLVEEWRNNFPVGARAKMAFLPAVDKQTIIRGVCYWTVTVYSDEVTHLHRWKTFFVPLSDKRILIEDANGDAVITGEAPFNSSLNPDTQHKAAASRPMLGAC